MRSNKEQYCTTRNGKFVCVRVIVCEERGLCGVYVYVRVCVCVRACVCCGVCVCVCMCDWCVCVLQCFCQWV
jgi:hypothetical protein